MTEPNSTHLLDEENELYGYGVYNTHTNQLINLDFLADTNTKFNGEHLIQGKDTAKQALQKVAHKHDLDSVSHLRIVEVRLENNLDHQASEVVK